MARASAQGPDTLQQTVEHQLALNPLADRGRAIHSGRTSNRLALALRFHIAADLIRDAWRHFIYETSACFDGFYCFVGVLKATSDIVCDDYERTVFNFRKNSLDPLRYITSDANENRVILQVVQSGDIVTLMLAYINSPLLHT